MITIKKEFNYSEIRRETLENGERTYFPNNSKPVPSVTTILSKTKDGSFLEEWRNRIGDEEADKILRESIMLGSHLHSNLENYILGNNTKSGPLLAKLMTDIIIKNGLKNVPTVLGLEVPLYVTDLYAGTADLIGFHENEITIIDFKNSKRNKKKEWVEDYLLQLCAYAKAHNHMYGTDIKKGVIMMATRDCKYLEFVISDKEFKKTSSEWDKRVEEYYSVYGHLHSTY